jgi:solute carrier family 25 oxoglutarate transporter 11
MQTDNTLSKANKRNYKNGFDALYRITSEEGFLKLWKGSAPTFYRACIITSTQLGIYDEVKEQLIKTGYFGNSLITYTISTLCCSVVSGIVSNPFDIAKSRLMHMHKNYIYSGTFSVINYILKNEGPIGLTKGLNAAILRQIPLNLLRFNLVEILKVYI